MSTALAVEGSAPVALPPGLVWRAITDPDILARSVPGCESVERLGPDRFAYRIRAKIGPVAARFVVDMAIRDADPPHAYRLEASLRGALLGAAKGEARVRLDPEGPGTRLVYQAQALTEGALARLAAGVVRGTAERYAASFFADFAAVAVEVGRGWTDPEPGGHTEPPPSAAADPAAEPSLPVPPNPVPWVVAAVSVAALLWRSFA